MDESLVKIMLNKHSYVLRFEESEATEEKKSVFHRVNDILE